MTQFVTLVVGIALGALGALLWVMRQEMQEYVTDAVFDHLPFDQDEQ